MMHLFIDVYKLGQDALIYAYQEQKFLFQTTPIYLLLQIVVDIVCMCFFGVLGVAISWHLFAFISGFITNRYLLYKQHLKNYSWKMYIQFDEYDRIIVQKIFFRLPLFVKRWIPAWFKITSL